MLQIYVRKMKQNLNFYIDFVINALFDANKFILTNSIEGGHAKLQWVKSS